MSHGEFMGAPIPPEMQEKCAVVGVVTVELSAPHVAAQALFSLQHRGQDASGLAVNNDELQYHGGLGQVRTVYGGGVLDEMEGKVAVGHNRYPTSGDPKKHPQPVYDRPAGVAYAHNGNEPVLEELESELHRCNVNPHGMNDSEMEGNLIASKVRSGLPLEEAIRQTYRHIKGAVTGVVMQGNTLAAFKDPCGMRPGVLGKLEDGGFIVASETCALDVIGATAIRELNAGELVVVRDGEYHFEQLADPNPKLDIFELIYFARPDSIMFGQHVSEMRRRLGMELAKEHPIDGDLVIGVPRSGTFAGEGYAEALRLPHSTALIKNEYTGRTFQLATQHSRQEEVRFKMNMLPARIEGKDLIMVDDSLVRGNTLKHVVELAYYHGARSVNVLLASPPVPFPDFYGIDTKSQSELLAANNTEKEIKEFLGCDYLGYLSLQGMLTALQVPPNQVNLSCFTGEYPLDIGARAKEIYTPKTQATV